MRDDNHMTVHYCVFLCDISWLMLHCVAVHDCAARLPNGEGTRNDICELLKDSQFLAPGVTDAQVCSSWMCQQESFDGNISFDTYFLYHCVWAVRLKQ